jgi:hypothetical protein
MQKKQVNTLIKKSFFILLLFLIWPITAIIALIGIIQTTAQLFGGSKIDSLMTFSTELISYFTNIAKYITGLKDKAPFPF